jgi:hypothetical protein
MSRQKTQTKSTQEKDQSQKLLSAMFIQSKEGSFCVKNHSKLIVRNSIFILFTKYFKNIFFQI